jgi:hypothetical protein
METSLAEPPETILTIMRRFKHGFQLLMALIALILRVIMVNLVVRQRSPE